MSKFLLSFILSFMASASAAKPKLVVLNTIEAPPFVSESSPEGGAAAFAMREQFKKMGYNLHLNFMPFARAKVSALHDPQIMGYAPCSETDLVKGFVLSKPIFETKTLLIQRKDRPIHWNSPEDLKKYRAGQVVGYSLKGPLQTENLNVEFTVDDAANLLKVATKHVDFAMITGSMFDYLMNTDPYLKPFRGDLEANSKEVTTVHWSVAFKDTPRGRRLLEEFNSKTDAKEFKKSAEVYLNKYKNRTKSISVTP
jgi:polar amino acid transport system substrate-binding protein